LQEMTPHADIISARYTKSVIKSCAAMSYVEAQARMDDRCLLPLDLLRTLHHVKIKF
jgi:exoribonuclease R